MRCPAGAIVAMKRLLLPLVLAVLLVPPPSARADVFPGQEPASTAITDLVNRSEVFWQQRGVNACPGGVMAWVAPSLQIGDVTAWGGGDGATCEIWVAQSLVRQVNHPVWLGQEIEACTAVAHEVGHAYGLGHTPTGLMSVTGSPATMYGWSPQFCFRWARFTYAAVLRGDGDSEKRIRHAIRYAMRLIRA